MGGGGGGIALECFTQMELCIYVQVAIEASSPERREDAIT